MLCVFQVLASGIVGSHLGVMKVFSQPQFLGPPGNKAYEFGFDLIAYIFAPRCAVTVFDYMWDVLCELGLGSRASSANLHLFQTLTNIWPYWSQVLIYW